MKLASKGVTNATDEAYLRVPSQMSEFSASRA